MEDGHIVGVAQAGPVERNVDVEAVASALTHVVIVALAQVRPKGSSLVAVYRKVQHSDIGVR